MWSLDLKCKRCSCAQHSCGAQFSWLTGRCYNIFSQPSSAQRGNVSICLCTLRLPLSCLLQEKSWEARLFLGSWEESENTTFRATQVLVSAEVFYQEVWAERLCNFKKIVISEFHHVLMSLFCCFCFCIRDSASRQGPQNIESLRASWVCCYSKVNISFFNPEPYLKHWFRTAYRGITIYLI